MIARVVYAFREMWASFRRNLTLTAAAVLTLKTSAPASSGSLPRGTSRPVITWISCFSEPCGYFVLSGRMLRSASSLAASCMAAPRPA